MKIRPYIILILLAVSCKTTTTSTEWHTLDYRAFKLKTPSTWVKFSREGIDSYVGGLTNGKDSLWFYLGWHGKEIENYEAENYLYAQDTINGHIATIQIPKIDGQGSIRLSITKVNERDIFDLAGYKIKGTDTILKIFKSVIFENSDTTKNSTLTLSKFREFPFGSGRTLYFASCAPCHDKDRDLTGPALSEELLNTRGNDWLFKFLTNRQQIKIDSANQAKQKNYYHAVCREFPDYSRNDIDQIVSYLKGK